MMRARRKTKTLGLGVAAGLMTSLALGACNESTEAGGDEECVSDEQFFQENIYTAILAQDCAQCHNPSGAAKDTSFIIRDKNWGPDYVDQNMEMFAQLSKLQYEGTPWILLKPTNKIAHEGAERFAEGSDDYKTFQEMIERFENPTVCDEGDAQAEFFDGVELLDEVATLRKATLSLAGRLPTIEEEERVRNGGFEALDQVLLEVMAEDEFYVRLKEIYNDHLLTDRYYPDTQALDLLDSCDPAEGEMCDYPNAYWFDSLSEEQRGEAASFSNKGVAREPLELVAHVVRNDLPYTEILTADYTMVNWYSAQSLGVDPSKADPNDYSKFVPAQIPGVPHAGVLTTTVWMNRFPTTPTNRNRHRSRMLAEFFLATDLQALGSRPVDATAIEGFNPTMNDPNCTICHAEVDPPAGAFQNWDEQGRYRPPESGWFADMLPPGFGDLEMPYANSQAALQWLVREVVKDRRFAVSAVHIMYKGLTGQDPLQEPDDPQADGYLEAIKAAKIQTQVFDGIAQKFIDSNYNLKTVVLEIVKTEYYRAHNAFELDETREKELKDLGTGRLLIPEQLNRKIVAATGYPWRGFDVTSNNGIDYLVDMNIYRLFYGGIDSDNVTERITEPNGIMANVAKRMANEMSCLAVPQDFTKDPANRVLFPLVERDFSPEDSNGFEVPAASAAIRANIQYLAQRMWGEYLELNDPEINRVYELYVNVWKDGQAGLALPVEEGGYGTNLPGACVADVDYFSGEPIPEGQAVIDDSNYTVRAWMAVMTYMLSDYRFLSE